LLSFEKDIANLGFASVDNVFLRITIGSITLSTICYLYNVTVCSESSSFILGWKDVTRIYAILNVSNVKKKNEWKTIDNTSNIQLDIK